MIQCKYLLPCGWCDKDNKVCHIKEEEILNSHLEKCNHSFKVLTQGIENKDQGFRGLTVYICEDCGELKYEYKELQ